MKHLPQFRVALHFVGIACASACASAPPDENALSARDRIQPPAWTAYVGFGAYDLDRAKRLGRYADRDACQAAVDDWRASQVAGTFVWGECLTRAE